MIYIYKYIYMYIYIYIYTYIVIAKKPSTLTASLSTTIITI